MKLRVTQCSVGKYYLGSNEESLSFYMSIHDNNNNELIKENGLKAQIHYSGDPNDLYIFEDALSNIEEVFTYCLEYSKKVISSVDYEAQCLLFYKIYQQNFETINTNMRIERDKRIKEQIESLQKELECKDVIHNLQSSFENYIYSKIKHLNQRIDYYNEKNSELKEDSLTYQNNKKFISDFKNQIEKYKDISQLYQNSQ
jgi:hypothetical protein